MAVQCIYSLGDVFCDGIGLNLSLWASQSDVIFGKIPKED